MKICNKCHIKKQIFDFYKNTESPDSHSHRCKVCDNEIRAKNNQTKNGLISRIYGNQKVSSKKRGHHAPQYTLSELKEWFFVNKKFEKIYQDWVDSKFEKDLTPSVDRINDLDGYSFENIQLITWCENNRKGNNESIYGIHKRKYKS